MNDDFDGVFALDEDASEPDASNPYQVETLVMRKANNQDREALTALLDTHVMSRNAIAKLQSEPALDSAESAYTVVDILVPKHIRDQARIKDDEEVALATASDAAGVDLMLALGIEVADDEGHALGLMDTLLIWLAEVLSERPAVYDVERYCDVLMRLAEEAAEAGKAGLAAVSLRLRRQLLRLDADELTGASVRLSLLQWPMSVAAYLHTPADRYAIDSLLSHLEATQLELDTEVEGISRLHQLLLQEAGPSGIERHREHAEFVREAGDSVFMASQSQVTMNALLRQFERLVSGWQSAAESLPPGPVSQVTRELRRVERRLSDLRQVSLGHYKLCRAQHSNLAGSITMPAGEAFAGLKTAIRAAAIERRVTFDAHFQGEEVDMDDEAIDALDDPLAELVWWMARHGIPEPSTERRAGRDIIVRFARRKADIIIDLLAEIPALKAIAVVGATGDKWDAEFAGKLLETATQRDTRRSAIEQYADHFQVLHESAQRLGGSCRLRYSDKGVYLRVKVPAWLTHTAGRLVPAGGGLLTVRESGIEELLEVPLAELQRGAAQHTTIGGKSYRSFWLLHLLGLDVNRDTQDMLGCSAMLTRAPGAVVAVLAAGVSESLRFSVRGVGERMPRIPGIVGGTVLMGGELSPIIDLPTAINAHLRSVSQRGDGT